MKKLRKIVLVFCVLLSSFLVFLIPFGARTQGIDSRFGVNAFVLNRYEQSELSKPVNIMKDLGIGWSREEFIWRDIEPAKGDFQWKDYDEAISQFSSLNISILGVLDYSAPWATSDPNRTDADKYMPNIADWQNFVGRVVDRYKGQVHYWQIWNEPNVPVFFKPEPDAGKYLELLKSAHEIIKQKDPGAQVVLAGTSGVDVGYLEELNNLEAGNFFDVLAVHPYSFDFRSPPEEKFLKNMKDAQQLSEKFGGKPIWLTEFGWPTGNIEGVSEDIQAKYLARIYLISYQFPNVKKLFWYDLRNDGDNKNDRENNFGLINKDYTKKKSFLAYKNLINILEGSQFENANINGENGFYDFYFIKGGYKIRVVWKINGLDNLTLVDSSIDVKILDFVGADITSKKENGSVVVGISDSPVFIITNK
ncbi:MAG: glycosyl hydrolase [Patescibacteria group bacterium]|nr:glycosyl hydrolase [Patescibacteria group bacterium]